MSIKKTLCVLALSLPVIAPAAQAYDFVKDGIYYNLSNDRKPIRALTPTHTREMW